MLGACVARVVRHVVRTKLSLAPIFDPHIPVCDVFPQLLLNALAVGQANWIAARPQTSSVQQSLWISQPMDGRRSGTEKRDY